MIPTPATAVRAELRAGLHDLSDQLLSGAADRLILDALRHLHPLLTLAELDDATRDQVRELLVALGAQVLAGQGVGMQAHQVSRAADRV